jgi:hypothetical protein
VRWKTLGLLACLLIDAILAACGTSSPRIPKGAKEPLDRYYSREFLLTEYSLVSAQQATQVVGIDEALRSQGVTPHGLSEVDEAWCVTTDPVVKHVIEGTYEEDWEDKLSEVVWAVEVILIVRQGDRWNAGAVWEYFDHDVMGGSASVAQETTAVLMALGCK